MAKMAITTAKYGPIRRFLSTESSVKEGESAAGSTESNSQNTSAPSPDKKQPSHQQGKSGGRRNRKDLNLSEDRTSMAAAATVISEDSDKKDSSESKPEPPQFPSTITRLVDNHPLSEEDFDPHQFLIHLSEDKLDRAPPTPLFDEETADNLPRSHRITGKDRNGNEVTIIEHLPPKNEERMNQLGFYFSKKDMHGYSNETPMLLHKGPLDHFHGDETDGMSIDVLSTLAEETDFADSSNETPSKSSNESQNEVENDVPLERRNDFSRMRLLGDLLEGTAFHPGSDIQLDLELEMLVRNAEFRRLRRDSLQFERGYDNRSYSNSTPWIDTHRIEAIDARLHELHQMRETGELDYPIENDAAVEAKRIRREQKIVRNAISHMLGKSRETDASDAYLFSKQIRKSPQQSFPLAAKERDASLDEMDVYAIPVEKLYQARRQELDKLRETSYEDFDLDYLLSKSGRSFESRGNAASLYELRHGYNEVTRNAIPAEMDARKAGREAMLLDYLEGIAKKSANGIYNGKVRMVTEDMEKALQGAESVELGKEESEENEEDETASNTSAFTPESLHTSETVDHVPDEYTVSEELGSVQRPPSAMKRPLKDIEVGVSPNGDMKVFWRANRQMAGDFSRDKREFFQQVDEMLNKWDGNVSEEEKNRVISSQDMENSRRNVGQPPDVSSETFHSRYLNTWKDHANDAKLVTELLGGVSVEQPEKILKELGIDSEDGIEKYLMDTFESHEAPVEQLYPPELLQARKTREKADRLIEQLKKQLAKKNAASKNDETSKTDGETPSETPKEGSETSKEKASSETPKEGSEISKYEEASESPKESGETPIESEAANSSKEEDEIPVDTPSETPSKPLSFEESFARMYDRFTKDGEAALSEIPDDSGVIGEGHPVDALEYSDEVYVHEKDRQLIYAMFRRGSSPKEISRSFGFAESRVTAIIRLMEDRERHQKEGTFDARIVDQLEENESPWSYDYRDFPPASYRFEDHRKKATIPPYIPKFVFLKEGEEEEKVMREVESLIRRNNHKKDPVIHRKELKTQKGRDGNEM